MNTKITAPYIRIDQISYPYFLTELPASNIYNNDQVIRISEDSKNGIQRFLDPTRVDSIARYCEEAISNNETPIFVTPVIISLNSDYIVNSLQSLLKDSKTGKLTLELPNKMLFEDTPDVFTIIDGQHRLAGIEKFERSSHFEHSINLPVVFILDADVYQSANIFITINANQRKVNSSIIYQLFGLIEDNGGQRTVQSFASKIVNILYNTQPSPFYHKIKILGKTLNDKEAFISQATIANQIASNTWRKSNGRPRILTQFYDQNAPDFLSKVIINYFTAFSEIVPNVWENNTLAKKAVGFSALFQFMLTLIDKEDDLTRENFKVIWENVNSKVDLQKLFKMQGSSESVATKIRDSLLNAYQQQA